MPPFRAVGWCAPGAGQRSRSVGRTGYTHVRAHNRLPRCVRRRRRRAPVVRLAAKPRRRRTLRRRSAVRRLAPALRPAPPVVLRRRVGVRRWVVPAPLSPLRYAVGPLGLAALCKGRAEAGRRPPPGELCAGVELPRALLLLLLLLLLRSLPREEEVLMDRWSAVRLSWQRAVWGERAMVVLQRHGLRTLRGAGVCQAPRDRRAPEEGR